MEGTPGHDMRPCVRRSDDAAASSSLQFSSLGIAAVQLMAASSAHASAGVNELHVVQDWTKPDTTAGKTDSIGGILEE